MLESKIQPINLQVIRQPPRTTLFPYTTLFRSTRTRFRESTRPRGSCRCTPRRTTPTASRSEEHTSELQSRLHLVCRLLLEKKKKSDGDSDQPIDLKKTAAATFQSPLRTLLDVD